MVESSGIPSVKFSSIRAEKVTAQHSAEKLAAKQIASKAALSDAGETAINISRRFETLESKRKPKHAEKKKGTEDKKVQVVERIEKAAKDLEKKNSELRWKTLMLLKKEVDKATSREEIAETVDKFYKDPSLADEALDFLEQVSEGETEEFVKEAKKELNETKGREIKAGRNMGKEAREFSQKGLGDPQGLRDLYRQITGNPKPPNAMFEELSGKFSYESLEKVIEFLLHSLGSDAKAKGPSIPKGELFVLMSEVRSMQGIIGVYRFFKKRMQAIYEEFKRKGIASPPQLTFMLIARMFMRLVQERYPSPDKTFKLADPLGIKDDLFAQAIVYTSMRDATRGISPRMFNSEMHRQDIQKAILDTIEEIDQKIEEEQEKKKQEGE